MFDLLYKYKTYIGLSASIIGLLSFRSMLYKMYKTKDTFDFPYEALILTLIGWTMMFMYGVLNKSVVTTVLGLVYFCIFLFILITKIKHPKKG